MATHSSTKHVRHRPRSPQTTLKPKQVGTGVKLAADSDELHTAAGELADRRSRRESALAPSGEDSIDKVHATGLPPRDTDASHREHRRGYFSPRKARYDGLNEVPGIGVNSVAALQPSGSTSDVEVAAIVAVLAAEASTSKACPTR